MTFELAEEAAPKEGRFSFKDKKVPGEGQSATEYLLMLAAACITVAIIVIAVTGPLISGKGQLGNSSSEVIRAFESMKSNQGLVQIASLTDADEPAPDSTDVIYFVSPDGNDLAAGTMGAPFATIARAADAVAEYDKKVSNPNDRNTVRVILRGGTYYLEKTLDLNAMHSGTAEHPVVFEAYAGESPIISGGKRILGWTSAGNGVWKSDPISEVKEGKWNFQVLRAGDTTAVRARYPNYDTANPYTGGFLTTQWCGNPWEKGMFEMNIYGNSRLELVGEFKKGGWDINVSQSGNYFVWVRYIHMDNNIDGKLFLRSGENGTEVPLNNISQSPDWQTFAWSKTASIALSQGSQRLFLLNPNGVNNIIDAFILTTDASWNPNSNLDFSAEKYTISPRPNDLLVIQGEALNYIDGNAEKDYSQSPAYPADDICMGANFPDGWSADDWNNAEVSIWPINGGSQTIGKVESANPANKSIHVPLVGYRAVKPIDMGARYYIMNAKSALDADGEWYLDKTSGVLYYKTQQDPNSLEIVAPRMNTLLRINGTEANFAHNISFDGINFTDTDYTPSNQSTMVYYSPIDGAIALDYAHDIRIRNSSLKNLGNFGVLINNKSHNNYIYADTFDNLGGGGIFIGNNSTINNQPNDNSVSFNKISNTGRIYRYDGSGVVVWSGNNTLITHNDISNTASAGIKVPSDLGRETINTIVEYNKITNADREISDMGPIYFWKHKLDSSDQHAVIRYNFVKDSGGVCTSAFGKITSPCTTSGIYLDNGVSGVDIYGNIIADSAGTAIGCNSVHDVNIYNNIFYNAPNWPNPKYSRIFECYNWYDNIRNDSFTNNIVDGIKSDGGFMQIWNTDWRNNYFTAINSNIYWGMDPNSGFVSSKDYSHWSDFSNWQEAGWDRNSVIADPHFAGAENDNFRLDSNSPALRLGFNPIPTEQIGNISRQGDASNQSGNGNNSAGNGYPFGKRSPIVSIFSDKNVQVNEVNASMNSTVNLKVFADGAGSTLTQFGATEMPEGAQFYPATGDFSWMPTQPGKYTAAFFAENSNSQGNSQTVIINVSGTAEYYWPLDNSSGDTVPEATFGKDNGLLTLNPGSDSGWVAGKDSNGFYFDGNAGGCIKIWNDNYQILPPDNMPFTIALWIKANDVSSLNQKFIMANDDYARSGFRFAILGDSWGVDQNKLVFWSSQDGGSLGLKYPQVMEPNKWYHIIISYTGESGAMYIDGSKVAQANGTVVSSNMPFGVGGDFYGNNEFSGVIDKLRIYNHAFGDGEAEALYNSGG